MKQSPLIGYENFKSLNLRANKKIDLKNQVNVELQEKRIGQPYFISKGTLMYVNHSDFILVNKLICLLVYEKIISGDIIKVCQKLNKF